MGPATRYVDVTDDGDGRLVSEAPMTVPAASTTTFLYFAHSYHFPTNTVGSGLPTYPDGARALVQALDGPGHDLAGHRSPVGQRTDPELCPDHDQGLRG